jgi:hypothetical protein
MKQNRVSIIAVAFIAAIDYCTGYLGMTAERVDALIDIITA